MKSKMLLMAAATLLAGAAVAQTGMTPVPPPGQPMPPEPMEPGEPPAPVPPEMPEDAMMTPPAPMAPNVVVIQPNASTVWAAPPTTETGKAQSGRTTMQDLQTVQPVTKEYPLCTRTRVDSCRNPGSK